MASEQDHLDIKNRAAVRLLALPGVVAVGLGSKEVADERTRELAIKVFVKVKRAREAVPADEVIPPQFEGIPTDVVESGEMHPLAAVPPQGAVVTPYQLDDARYRPLIGGACIRREGSESRGTLGCFLVDREDPSVAYGLTAFHVIAMPDVVPPLVGTTRVGQPCGDSSSLFFFTDKFGTFVGGMREGEDRDEALIRLDPGTGWRAEILEIGRVKGDNEIAVKELKELTAAKQTYKVRKRGIRTGLTGGVVRAVEATTNQAENLIVIEPSPNPAAVANQTVYFAYEGDSGAAIVNDANEVIGLLLERDKGGNGYASPIGNVLGRVDLLERLRVRVAVAEEGEQDQVNVVPGTTVLATAPELRGALTRAAPALPPRPPPGWVREPASLTAPSPRLGRDLTRLRRLLPDLARRTDSPIIDAPGTG